MANNIAKPTFKRSCNTIAIKDTASNKNKNGEYIKSIILSNEQETHNINIINDTSLVVENNNNSNRFDFTSVSDALHVKQIIDEYYTCQSEESKQSGFMGCIFITSNFDHQTGDISISAEIRFFL
jgi:hypothetical protein